MRIIDLLNKIVNGELVPRKIRYNMMMKGYDVFEWDEDAQEYINSADESLSVPNHHLKDEIEIIIEH